MKWEAGRRGVKTLGGWEVGGTYLGVGGWEELCTMHESGAPADRTAGAGGQGWSMELAWVSYYTLSFAHFCYYWSTYDTGFPLCSLLFSFSLFYF